MKITSFLKALVCCFILGSTHTLLAQTNTYHLIVGSYVSFDLADQKIKDLAREGYEAIVVFPNDKAKRYRVSIYHSKTRNEVQSYSAMLKRQGRDAGWIYLEEPPKPNEVIVQNTPPPFSRSVTPNVTQPSTTTRAINTNITYHLIVGSYKDMISANDYANELIGKGFETIILQPDDVSDSYRVSIYFTHDKAEINAYASSVRRQGKVKGWIYEQHREDGTRSVAPSQAAPATPISAGQFYLITASFKDHVAATEHAVKVRREGLKPMILLPKPGETARYRIAVFNSSQRAEVVAYQRQLKNQGKDGGWILNQ